MNYLIIWLPLIILNSLVFVVHNNNEMVSPFSWVSSWCDTRWALFCLLFCTITCRMCLIIVKISWNFCRKLNYLIFDSFIYTAHTHTALKEFQLGTSRNSIHARSLLSPLQRILQAPANFTHGMFVVRALHMRPVCVRVYERACQVIGHFNSSCAANRTML